MADDTREWCWHDDDAYGSERLHGPFATREEAIADAYENVASLFNKGKFVIGRVEWLAPADFVPDDLYDVLERMDEYAGSDYGYDGDDRIFEAKCAETQSALTEALKKWANEYLYSNVWIVADTEIVECDCWTGCSVLIGIG